MLQGSNEQEYWILHLELNKSYADNEELEESSCGNNKNKGEKANMYRGQGGGRNYRTRRLFNLRK